jgi:hypothetical protein
MTALVFRRPATDRKTRLAHVWILRETIGKFNARGGLFLKIRRRTFFHGQPD